ncbi:LPXTG-motif cell wall anchor domain-containing protein [Georgenia satyanarayanai]|uniref:LPXTG-motif cell wall anchor domain-containing protein n=1 Tax=Georgenia satyanarayanai TaxID=860221 RepID=A0A2Y8ZXM8_9MICO|nr:cohesin domain-containing protein [Georgenia satyanarayanai]PYG02231.1 LPXTG-motif cell wall-anchored protein [Georgenia satyanarayanai]SSA37071.1 LPXTG-motif cell wall anchor domain-containing protein [Georgenia satyanarayanai]
MPPRPRPRRAAIAAPLCAGVLVLSAAPALAAPETTGLSLTVPATATVGDTISLGLELGDTVDVYAYALTVEADPDVLAVVPDSVTGPGGGFDSTEPTAAGVTVVHSRLGSSPALAGDLDAGVELTVVGAGTTSVEVAVELVGADGTTTTLPAVASAEMIVAAPTPSPSPTDPDPAPTEPDPAPEEPSPTPTDDDGAPAPTAAPPTSGGGSLPSTGLDARGLGVAAAVLAALGGAAVLLRRRTGGAL